MANDVDCNVLTDYLADKKCNIIADSEYLLRDPIREIVLDCVGKYGPFLDDAHRALNDAGITVSLDDVDKALEALVDDGTLSQIGCVYYHPITYT